MTEGAAEDPQEETEENGAREACAVLVEDARTRRWRIELRDLRAFREALGDDVLAGFCACFAHADRLVSLMHFSLLSEQSDAEGSPGGGRNLETMAWFVVGTLREFALAVRALRSALAKCGLLNPNTDAWVTLRDIEERWDGDPFFRDVRNKVAFHIDLDLIKAGLTRMEANGNAVLVDSKGREVVYARFLLAGSALLEGLGMDSSEIERFMRTVRDDHVAIHERIQEVFLQVLDTKGIPYGPAGGATGGGLL